MPDINAQLPLDKAELIAFFLESILYGVSALLFVITIWVLIYHRKSVHLNKRLVVTSSLMTLFNTLHISVDLLRILEGFINRRDQTGGPVMYFGRLFEWSFVFKTAIFVVQTVLADSFATYRCFVVWNRWWGITIPATSVLATLVTGIGVVYNCARLDTGGSVFSHALTGWITAFFTLTLASNLCCTTLIASRIWFTTKKVARFSGQQTLLPVVIVVIESGAIYSISCITILVVYLLNSNAQYPAIDGMFPIISISFNLIIVRIALGISHGGASGVQSTQNPPSESGIIAPGRRSAHHHGHTSTHGYPMKPLAITVTQLMQCDDTDTDDNPAHMPVSKEDDACSFTDDSQVTRGKEHGSCSVV